MIDSAMIDLVAEVRKDPVRSKVLGYELQSLRSLEQRTVGVRVGNFFGFLSGPQKAALKSELQKQ